MNSKAHLSPLVQNIVLGAIRNIKQREKILPPSYKINTDLVPRISERTLTKNNMQESILIQPSPEVILPKAQPVQVVKQLSAVVAQPPVQTIVQPQVQVAMQQPAQRIAQPLPIVQQAQFIPQEEDELTPTPSKIAPVPSSQNILLNSIYKGKMAGLINDSSVLSIECLGQGIPLTIFRAGQKQRTKIILSKQEIENMLGEISSQTKIPLSEGIFKVIVNNLMINAIISDLIGTRFVIKKLFQMQR